MNSSPIATAVGTGAKVWNPVKAKLMAGQKITGGTLF